MGQFNATLLRTACGKLIALNFDSNPPHPRSYCLLQGDRGTSSGVRHTLTWNSLIYLDGVSRQAHT